jgi:hypothetical protein
MLGHASSFAAREDEMNEHAGKAAATQVASSPSSAGILRRRCECGNHTSGTSTCSACEGKKMGLQRKLFIGREDDPLEHEAERMADWVTSMGQPAEESPRLNSQSPSIASSAMLPQGIAQRATEGAAPGEDEERLPHEPLLLAREGTPAGSSGQTLAAGMGRSSGVPLTGATRDYMEPRFGHDFSRVRVHTDAASHQVAESIGAAAFTHRNDIYFRHGRFSPGSTAGRHLLAHELTHVIQQQGGSVVRRSITRAGAEILQRDVEVHANLRAGNHRVKVYRSSGADLGGSAGFEASAGAPATPTQMGSHEIRGRRDRPVAREGIWGLRYFAPFFGEQGFHSHITYPLHSTLCAADRSRYADHCGRSGRVTTQHDLIVDGAARSHGCVRLHEPDARQVWRAVRNGTRVFIYDRRRFRSATFAAGGTGSRSGGSGRSGGSRTHTVIAGDTLGEIAEQYGVTIEALRSANDIAADSEHIEIGQTLTIPES